MIRRAFLALVALLVTGKLSRAQRPPSGDRTVPEVLNIQGLITQVLRVATRVEAGAEQLLRDVVVQQFKIVEVPNVRVREVSPGKFPDLLVGQGNLSILLLTVLEAAKTAEGQIIVTRQAIEQALKGHCPLYPFC